MTPVLRLLAACAAACFATVAVAKGAGDFARQWPVQADNDGAYAITLTPEIYAQVQRGDLADLAAFNADGEQLAFGPLPAALVHPAPHWRDAVWFALPTATSRAAGDLHVHATRNAAGELAFDATVVGNAITDERPDLLVDVKPGREAIDQLEVVLLPDADAVNVQLRIEASNDLQDWETLVPAATVARLLQGGAVLERRIIELPATNAAFLRLRPADGAKPLPLQSVRVRAQPAAPEHRLPPEQWIAATFVRQDQRAWHYRLPGRLPAQRLDIALSADNAIDKFVVYSRDDDKAGWQMRGGMTAFRLRGGGVSLDNPPMEFGATRDSQWRLDASTDLGQPPTVRFAFHPETFLLLTHGKPPYVIAAGSARGRRGDFPLDALYGQVRARYGGDWEPPLAALGAMRDAGGEAALHAPPPDRTRQWVLWAILGIGAFAIILMVVKLMRDGPEAA
jgi:hypothetical protein